MRLRFICALVAAATGATEVSPLFAETLDRIAVTVGKTVIAESAILRGVRVSAFLDGKPIDTSPAAERKAAARLVDQILILQEAADSHVTLPVEDDVNKALAQIKKQIGTSADYEAELARYGITEKDVAEQLADGFRTLRFSDLRFRPQVQISEEELRENYDQLAAGLRAKNQPAPSFESSRDELEQFLTQQRTADALDRWLAMTRAETQIEYRQDVIP